MSFIEKAVLAIAPQWAARREQARAVTMHYRAARLGDRSNSLRPTRSDADGATRGRAKVSAYVRDLVRNTPFAARAQSVVVSNVVGDGILPKIHVRGLINEEVKKRIKVAGLAMIEDHLDTTAIDVTGLQNFYGLQRLAMNAVFADGEVLIRRHRRDVNEGMRLQIEVLEADYIDDSRFGRAEAGGEIREGIEYDADGRRVAYWLFKEHPGGEVRLGADWSSERIPAEDIIHVFRVDRPGQTRGISWLTPIAEKLLILDDYEDAQLMRQRIASCFAAFRRIGTDSPQASVEIGGAIMPGTIMDIGPTDEMQFASPPDVSGYDAFTAAVLRSAAMGIGVSYEALTGDLSGVNFSSARIGRLEMERNITSWQWLMLVPQMLQPFGKWLLEEWIEAEPQLARVPEGAICLTWVPPLRLMVDPAREFGALKEAVRAGFQSRQGVVRQLGVDPERLEEEQWQDKLQADRLGLPFDSDPRADPSRLGKEDEGGPSKQEDTS